MATKDHREQARQWSGLLVSELLDNLRHRWATGLADRLGSIEPGKEATLLVCDRDILDIRCHVERMWIAGKEVSLQSRHTQLYEKYRHRPSAK